MILGLWVTVLSTLLIQGFVIDFQKYTGQKFNFWRRWLIPLPIFLLLGSNIDGLLSHQAWLETHPYGIPIRYAENEVWNSDRLFTFSIWFLILVPLLCQRPKHYIRIATLYGLGHIMWFFMVLMPLMLGTGFPLMQD